MFNFLFGGGKSSFAKLSVQDYQNQFVESKTPHTLIDVRTQSEFKNGHIPGAVNIPLDKLRGRLDDISSKKAVVVVCATGSRSASAARMLAKTGRTDIHNLQGGTMRWASQGNPLKR